ncbi:hypothetical protein [Desulfosporosinus sp. I2]|uniref:hypothetical protein n=1 Tax=Desulfosporosinus sp. I2 TaxID=1617025 RepID=UPI0018CFC64B|nr:hypothetical protein [Desulfosporosinus sp. I2]
MDSINNLMLWVNQGIGKSIVPNTALDPSRYPNIVVEKADFGKPFVTRMITYKKTIIPRKEKLINAFYTCSRDYLKSEEYAIKMRVP